MTRADRLRLTWFVHGGLDVLWVTGLTAAELRVLATLPAAARGRRLAVFPTELAADINDVHSLQSVAGVFQVVGDAVCFIPRFPFVDGAAYTLFVAEPSDKDAHGRLQPVGAIARPATVGVPSTEVVAIYPSVDTVPVNLLKLYVHFSQPMSEGWVARAVRVQRADTGEPLHGVFLPPRPELWDRERTLLTLFLDPGRIKRGLVPHEEAGYPLIEGVPVVVTIDVAFRDAMGRSLRASAERRYNVGPQLHQRVIPADWRVHCPPAGSREPLTLAFDRPLDHALLQHALNVHKADGALVVGQGLVGADELSWQFTPEVAWRKGRYVVSVDPRLEDLAGNSVARVFDRDLTRAEDTPVEARQVVISFRCA